MKLSVVILNYNVRYFLELCVISVQDALQNIESEIIVVDNDSSDDSCEMMKRRFPNIRLIENKENCGFPKGNNIGVKQAKGEYICILNPDTVVAEDTFKKVLAFADSKSNLGIVGVKLIDGTGNFLPESKRGIPTPFVAFSKIMRLHTLFPKSSAFGKYYASHLNSNETGKIEILVGAFMLMKRKTYLDVGGFDEHCFMYADDIDLSYMVLKTGKANYYFHETTVIHYKGESTAKDGLYMKRFREAMHFFYKKHFRVSPFFDVFMMTGALLFSMTKKSRISVATKKVSEYVLLSDDENLALTVENFLEKKLQCLNSKAKNTLNSLVDGLQNDVEIIFDNGRWSFKSIINSMEEYKNCRLTFKILPAESNFIIGSNSSHDRGEVIKL